MRAFNTVFRKLKSVKEKWWQWGEIGTIAGVSVELMQPSSWTSHIRCHIHSLTRSFPSPLLGAKGTYLRSGQKDSLRKTVATRPLDSLTFQQGLLERWKALAWKGRVWTHSGLNSNWPNVLTTTRIAENFPKGRWFTCTWEITFHPIFYSIFWGFLK